MLAQAAACPLLIIRTLQIRSLGTPSPVLSFVSASRSQGRNPEARLGCGGEEARDEMACAVRWLLKQHLGC